ncbi:hypothetical protein C8F01DRAFT_1183237 [Mycena amicta]|nr:hypothetical protein C8F01DRAFT_1183237 [Mycena amicta]
MTTEHPLLPRELEREIFEITVHLHPEMGYTLLFVARRVLIWIEPTLYRSLELRDPHRLSRLLTAKSREFFVKTTRHVSLDYPATGRDDALEVLDLCPRVTHLSLHTDNYDDMLHAAFLRLQQLRCLSFYPGDVLCGPKTDGSLPVFCSLTHLEILYHDDYDIESFCSALPVLTHLAVDADVGWPRAVILLAQCKKLIRLVLLAGARRFAENMEASAPKDFADPRVVITWYETWNEGVLDSHSYWDVVEEFLARKRRGLIKESRFLAERE